jgi:hypothetical protein
VSGTFFEAFSEGFCLVVHDIAIRVFEPGDGAAVDLNAANCETAGEIVLGHRRLVLQARFAHLTANDISGSRFSRVLHQRVESTRLTVGDVSGLMCVTCTQAVNQGTKRAIPPIFL